MFDFERKSTIKASGKKLYYMSLGINFVLKYVIFCALF